MRSLKIISDILRRRTAGEILELVRTSIYRSQRILVYSKDLTEPASVQRDNPPGVTIKKADPSFIERLREKEDYRIWEFSCDLYDGVSDAFVCEELNGRIGHISWIYYKDNPNRIINLAPDQAEIKYCFTLKEFRGKGLYTATLRTIQRYLSRNGFRRVFICVEEDNTPSIRGIERAGFELAGKVLLRKIMCLQVSRRFRLYQA